MELQKGKRAFNYPCQNVIFGFFERRDPSECRGHRVFRLGPDLLKKFGKFTGKYPHWSLFLNSAAS